MTKGKPWTAEEEAELKTLVEAKTSINIIAAKLGKRRGAVYAKCQRLELETKGHLTANSFPLPEELPSIEEALRKLAGALEAACAPGLDKVEVQRLQVIATLAKTYKEILADYINYREIENKLNDMEEKYAQLLQKKTTDDAPKPDSTQVVQDPAQ